MKKRVGILTAGGDSPGLNAAIRTVGKVLSANNYELWAIYDGFEGLAFDRIKKLEDSAFSGILTIGGTILHTSRSKPRKMLVNGEYVDMTDEIIKNYKKYNFDCIVCIGGGGTHKNALYLKEAGLNVLTMPKTIDNDLMNTESSIGFDTALDVATSAIDNLHSTASSHKRIILVEIMGHNAGWLTLGSGIAGGADVILIPEIPYDIQSVANELKRREKAGKMFSIVPVAEGAMSVETASRIEQLKNELLMSDNKEQKKILKKELKSLTSYNQNHIFDLAKKLEDLTNLESRVTILGYIQRGGNPSCLDRLLATQVGCCCAKAILEGKYGMMVSYSSDSGAKLIPLAEANLGRKVVELDHQWMQSARQLGICFGEIIN